jgi:hypothetical protein
MPIETGKAVTLRYYRNTVKAPNMGTRFGQHLEPHGRYLGHLTHSLPLPSQYEAGIVTFRNPLVVPYETREFPMNHDVDSWGWKSFLAHTYKKRGKALSRHLQRRGHDAVIAMYHPDDVAEIVDLRHMTESMADFLINETLRKRMGLPTHWQAGYGLTRKYGKTGTRPETMVWANPATKGRMVQFAGRCAPIAMKLAIAAGFKIPTASELHKHMHHLDPRRSPFQLAAIGPRPLTPSRSAGNLVVRGTPSGVPNHISFEHYGKEYNYGENSPFVARVLARIPLYRHTDDTPNTMRGGCYTCGREDEFKEGQCKKHYNATVRETNRYIKAILHGRKLIVGRKLGNISIAQPDIKAKLKGK